MQRCSQPGEDGLHWQSLQQRRAVSTRFGFRVDETPWRVFAAAILRGASGATGWFSEAEVATMLEKASELSNSAAVSTGKHALAQLRLSTANLLEMIGKCPDPQVKENSFMSFVRKNGPSMNALSKDVEKSLVNVQKSQGSEPGSSGMDEGSASAVNVAKEAMKDLVSIIVIQTMMVLIHNPASRNTSSEERKWLADVYQTYLDPTKQIKCYPQLIQEVETVLGVEPVVGSAAGSADDGGVAADGGGAAMEDAGDVEGGEVAANGAATGKAKGRAKGEGEEAGRPTAIRTCA